jgi:UDP-N-acetylglucosamine 2-epimerase (non-hydrolysing)
MPRPQKILVVFGTRPEAIKLAPLIRALKAEPHHFCARICVTGQHRSMLDQVLEAFEITPDHDLSIMQPGQDLYQITTRCLDRLKPVVQAEQPDWVLVQGDTTTTFAASLAAYYQHVRVGHIEAGLRTDDKARPFPEEMNRRLTSCIADLHFAPTPRARQNLIREGIAEQTIHVTGNTGIDALFYIRERNGHGLAQIPGLENWKNGRKMILVTGHRRENFGAGFQRICEALRHIALRGDLDLIYPVHLNPNVQQPVRSCLGSLPNVFLIDPQDYIPFVSLMQRAHIILTDSGGVQEEAPSLGKPVLVMREVTERPEAVEAGTATLVGTNTEQIVTETARLLEDATEYERRRRIHNPYGDGNASKRIIHLLASIPT